MLNNILRHFPGAKKNGNGYKATCPVHDDKTPSLSINVGEAGNVLLHCHAGCEFEAILASIGLTAKDLYPDSQPKPKTRIVATHDYRDETGKLLFQAVRIEPKKFYQRRPDGDRWINNLNGTRRVLYRLPELLKADKAFSVFIVEGEKDVDNLLLIEVIATCNPQGAGKWKDEYSEFLKGRRCVILPDNDEAGEEHANAVAKSLLGRAEDVSILRLPDLPEKGDVSDWIARGNKRDDLFALLTGADNITSDEIDRVSAKAPLSAASDRDGGSADEISSRSYTGENADVIERIGKDAEARETAAVPMVDVNDIASAKIPSASGNVSGSANGDNADASSRSASNNDESDPELSKNFSATDHGVFYRGEKATMFVCSPLRISAKTCDAENESWGRRLQFEDAQNVKHDLVIPMSQMSGDGADLRARLMDCGLIISSSREARQRLLQYLLSAKPKKHVRCVNQLGWHDGAFVLPDEVISVNGNRDSLLLQNIDRTANKFKTSGTLSDWQERIARYCVGNSRLMFAVSAAFAAALLPIAEETGGGFHLCGTSSTGKTTALFMAGSVWGGRSNKGFLDTWKSTGNGLEAVAELHNHSLLLLDEINEVNAYEVGEIVYALSNGFGKSRMNRNTTARRKAEWNLMFFSSGEETLEQKMQSVGQRTRGGQEARFVNIEADAGKGLGLYEDLHDFESANALADHLSTMSRKYYGTAIREFLRAVCANRSLVESRIKESRQMFHSKLRLQDTSGEVFRVATRFSLVTVAGILASEFGVTKWQNADVIACGERLFSEWLDTRGTTGSYDIEQGVKQVLSFIAQHGSSRFQSMGSDNTERINNRAGFVRRVAVAGKEGYFETEYLILPDIFDNEICKGFSATAIAKKLEQLGHLRRKESEPNYIKCKETLPGLGRKRVYILVFEGMSDEEK